MKSIVRGSQCVILSLLFRVVRGPYRKPCKHRAENCTSCGEVCNQIIIQGTLVGGNRTLAVTWAQ